MMAAVSLCFLLAATASATPTTKWEQIYSSENPRASLSAIGVLGDGRWVAGGGELIVMGGKGPAEVHRQPGKFIVSVSGGGDDPVLAVGADDLILRWDGHTWVQDSFAADAPKLSRARRRSLLLQGAFHPEGQPVVAYGPWRVLVRQADGTWKAPEEAERHRLMTLAQLGPGAPRPKGCDRLQWRRLSKDENWAGCRDGRNFVVDAAGALVDRGRLPKSCVDGLGTLIRRGNAILATCDTQSLWQSEGKRWERVQAPKLEAIAADGGCLYGVGERAVWRNCSLP